MLVIVHRADEWAKENITWLLKNSLFHRPAAQSRILMVGRSAEQWPRTQGILDSHRAVTSAQRVAG